MSEVDGALPEVDWDRFLVELRQQDRRETMCEMLTPACREGHRGGDRGQRET
jgi:hypothetical protein